MGPRGPARGRPGLVGSLFVNPSAWPELPVRMHPLEIPAESKAPLVREARALPAMGPASFLDAMHGRPRGFWGRGERWVAWGGALARVDLGAQPGRSRYDEVRRQVAGLVGGTMRDWAGVEPRSRPRFFGGFSFLDGPEGSDHWDGFSAAGFFLPRVVLEGGPGGVLLVRHHFGDGAHVEDVGPESQAVGAAASLDVLAEELLAAASNGSLRSKGVGTDPATPVFPPGGTSVGTDPVQRADPGDRRRWEAAVRSVLEAVESGEVRKAVLSRILDIRLRRPADPVAGLRVLRRENPRAHVFLLEPRPGRVFLGAAPEILAELRGRRFEATAVAGSVARGRDAEEDAALARRLLASSKDRAEHRLTAEEMVEVLAPRLTEMQVEDEPRVLRLARIQHLETVIRGRAGDGEDVLSLVEALHPTPAVCGRPRSDALELIRRIEPFERGWYAGPVGWVDPAGDGDFVPALRSAVGGGDRWRLFAGAGIVSGSEPEAEWEETDLKFEPALRALGAGVG